MAQDLSSIRGNAEQIPLLYAEELLDRIEKLANKIAKFIRSNNLYGSMHKYHPKKLGIKFTDEAVAVLLKEMEDKRGQFCVILAGYQYEMKHLLSAKPGFESRIQFTLNFPDYTRGELGQIANLFLEKKGYAIENTALEKALDVTDYYRNRPNFANARTVRNILDQVIMNQNLRTEEFADDNTIILDDVEEYISEGGIDLSNTGKIKRTMGFV